MGVVGSASARVERATKECEDRCGSVGIGRRNLRGDWCCAGGRIANPDR